MRMVLAQNEYIANHVYFNLDDVDTIHLGYYDRQSDATVVVYAVNDDEYTIKYPGKPSEAMAAAAAVLNGARELSDVDKKLGAWMSAALDDDDVCDEMKNDIRNWMEQFI